MLSLGAYEYSSNHQNLLGSGAFSYVYRGNVKNRPNELVAIKIMKKDQNMPKSKALLSKEINILKDLNHDNIVHLYDHGVSVYGVYLVMEYCNGGDLSVYLSAKGTLPEETIRHMLIQIGSAMNAINLKGVMHRDLKPGNILLCHCRDCGQSVNEIPGYMLTFKLADFGFARYLQDGMMAVTMCGSPMYMAPEVLMCRRYDAVADIWSMGVIVYQCLTSKAPFYASNPEALKIIYETTPYLKPKIPVTTSRALRDLLLRMLVRKPTERIDFETFLNHPFLHQKHFEPPANFMGTPSLATPMHHAGREPVTPVAPSAVATAPAIKCLGQGTGDGPFYMTPRPGQCTDRDRTPQRTVLPEDKERRADPVPSSQLPTYNQSSAAGRANATASPVNTQTRSPAFANFRGSDDNREEAEEEEEGDDDAMSRTTVDEYFEDELASMALPMAEPSRGYIQAVQPHTQITLIGMPTRVYSPTSPTLPSRVDPVVKPSDPMFPGALGGGTRDLPRSLVYGSASEAGEYLPLGSEDQHLHDYVIVNADGSEADRATRRHFLPNTNGPPPGSLISRIVANPVAYLTGKYNQDKPLPDVTGAPVNRDLPSSRKPVQPDRQREVDTPQQATPAKPLLSTPPSRVGAMSPAGKPQVTPPQSSTPMSSNRVGSGIQGASPATVLPTADGSPTVHLTTGVSPSRQKALLNQVETSPPCGVLRETDRPNLHSGATFLEYGGNLPSDMLAGGLWAAAEFSDGQLMDPEHNEEIKTITMVLELCELLTELAERRASVLSDCTATTPVAAVQQQTPPHPPPSDSPLPTNLTLTGPPVAPGMKFVSEARRIVEQIVLYRRVLYYLDYVFAQVKKAFQQLRLKSTLTARWRLTDCNALYHRCYIRLCQLVRQSRRDDLIEPVGKLLANITANRLIFDYALVQCQAAEIDHYAGDVVQSLQRYKAGITLIHGLRQHAKSNEDKSLLADCMRLLHDRYNHFRTRQSSGRQAEPTVDAVGGGECGQIALPPDLIVKTQPDSVPGRPCPSEAVG